MYKNACTVHNTSNGYPHNLHCVWRRTGAVRHNGINHCIPFHFISCSWRWVSMPVVAYPASVLYSLCSQTRLPIFYRTKTLWSGWQVAAFSFLTCCGSPGVFVAGLTVPHQPVHQSPIQCKCAEKHKEILVSAAEHDLKNANALWKMETGKKIPFPFYVCQGATMTVRMWGAF